MNKGLQEYNGRERLRVLDNLDFELVLARAKKLDLTCGELRWIMFRLYPDFDWAAFFEVEYGVDSHLFISQVMDGSNYASMPIGNLL